MSNRSKKASLQIAKITTLLMMTMSSTCAFAWGGVVTGKISAISVFNANNLPFRVQLEGSPVLCTGGLFAEAYVDDADANYKVYVSTLMMAKATNATVTLFSDVGQFS